LGVFCFFKKHRDIAVLRFLIRDHPALRESGVHPIFLVPAEEMRDLPEMFTLQIRDLGQESRLLRFGSFSRKGRSEKMNTIAL